MTRHSCLLLLCLTTCLAARGEDLREVFRDPEDGRLDASQWLLERRGALPVPIIITEPAVGYGGGVALVFFHRKDHAAGEQPSAPPSVSAVLGAATENGTKLGGLAHLGVWRNNTLRYTGVLGAMDINLTFYGGNQFPRLDSGVGYNMKGWATLQQLTWKLGASDFWLGPQVIYLDAETGLDEPNAPPVFDQLNGNVENLGAGVIAQYDTRDNIFTPGRGAQIEWYVRQHTGSFTDDFDYTEVDAKNRWYLNPSDSWMVALRADASFASEGVPFYAMPSIIQRGIPRGRYQGEAVIATEVEARYAIDSRWFAVAFAGVSRAGDSIDDLGSTDSNWAGGVGVRYLLARLLGLQVGIDVAKGPEEWAFYLQTGSAWIQ